MAEKRTKVPRASLACTILSDPEFIVLCLTPQGREAFALFCALLAAAKDQDNDGVFDTPDAAIAMMVRWPLDAYTAALDCLLKQSNWVAKDNQKTIIRSFKKWNSWGGERPGAGAPEGNRNAAKQSNDNQDSIKNNHSVAVSVAVASKDVNAFTAPEVAVTKDKPPKAPRTTKTHWSEPCGQQLSLLPEGSAKKVYPFLNKLARQYTEAAVLRALGKSQGESFANWKHAASWLTVVARDSQVTESNAYEDKLDD